MFGSDICTCRPYLIFGISEAIKCAQRGGVGVIIYFQKEGRALGEVIKYMVYNRRKRGGDSAAEYFNNTSAVAGVKDARHQDLMPDVLHWLGITHIENLISMSSQKYDAIIDSGITVKNRYEIPDYLIPADGRVEIDAKVSIVFGGQLLCLLIVQIQAGYFSSKIMNDDLVKLTKGRSWGAFTHRKELTFQRTSFTKATTVARLGCDDVRCSGCWSPLCRSCLTIMYTVQDANTCQRVQGVGSHGSHLADSRDHSGDHFLCIL